MRVMLWLITVEDVLSYSYSHSERSNAKIKLEGLNQLLCHSCHLLLRLIRIEVLHIIDVKHDKKLPMNPLVQCHVEPTHLVGMKI